MCVCMCILCMCVCVCGGVHVCVSARTCTSLATIIIKVPGTVAM